jgi:sugar O-acyltransferase (sialic acid O-acetyltransferase NeuD family)
VILSQGMKLVLWGAKGHARVLADIASAVGAHVVAVGDRDDIPSPLPNVPLFCGRQAFEAFVEGYGDRSLHYAVAIGGNNGADRLSIAQWLETLGLLPVTIQHPTAFVEPSATIAKGAQLLAQSYVGSYAKVGAHTILNTKSSIDHDSVAEEGGHLAPGSTVCGEVYVQRRAFVATGATVLPRLTIGQDAVVGAGALVTRSVPDGVIVMGVPARQIDR